MNGGVALPNVGPGPDPLVLRELEADFAVLLLHRDFYCSDCRQQVRRVKRRYEAFEERGAEVVSVLPEDRETAAEWQKQYHLPFPVVADAEKQWGDRFDQPRKYGLLGRIHDVIGRMPAAVVLDLRWSDPMETFAHRGDAKTDRPRIDELLAAIDEAATLAADSTPEQREEAVRAAAASDGAVPPETPAPDEAAGAPETDETEEPADAEEVAGTEAAPETTEAGEATESEPDDEDAADAKPRPDPVSVPEVVDLPGDVELRRATADDAMPVIRVLHGALLEIDGETVRRAVDRGDVLVADADGWVVGALVLEDNHIDTLAVRREHRKQGLGRALVEAAVAEVGGPVTADFRAGVGGFWAGLGFEIEQEGARFYGIRR